MLLLDACLALSSGHKDRLLAKATREKRRRCRLSDQLCLVPAFARLFPFVSPSYRCLSLEQEEHSLGSSSKTTNASFGRLKNTTPCQILSAPSSELVDSSYAVV
ncbi:hypothetical protein MTO96_005572 [Rhipicephalus appendiculatus]